MTHVFNQLTPFLLSYPMWLTASALLWVSGQVTQRGEVLKMFASFAIVIAAGIFVWQGH